MATLTPTTASGATAAVGPMVYVDPARVHPPTTFEELIGDSGLNGPFIADLLSDMLAHERAGSHLYRSVHGRTLNPVLESQYEHFGEETQEHVATLEDLIATLGGDPQYVSAAARATEKSGTGLVESTYLLGGSVDALTRELVMLEAVFLAEAKDHANWEGLGQLAPLLPDAARDPVAAAVEKVKTQEDEHLTWARKTRGQLVMLQAETPAPPPAITPPDELIERIQQMLA